MQPDTFSTPQDETQPEPAPVQEAVLVEAPSIGSPAPAVIEPAPVVEKKRSRKGLAGVALGVLVFLLVASIAWVGYWAYQLSTELTTTQQELSTLQAEHQKLQEEYQTLSSEKDQLAKDLEKANTDLATTKSDLSTAQQKSSNLTSKINKASKLYGVVYLWVTSDDVSDVFDLNASIEESGDQNLINKWNALKNAPSDDGFDAFLDYLLTATRDSLK